MSANSKSDGQNSTSTGNPVPWGSYRAVLFDLDGVITPTAEIHQQAWGQLFEPWGYTTEDYLRFIDGKPRYDGVRSFLQAKGESIPEGDPEDPPGDETVCGLGNKKNELFNAILEREGVDAYIGSLALLDHLDRLGVVQAIVSSSKNARSVLKAAGLIDRFPHIVDGVVAAREGLAGKPDPAMFFRAAELLGRNPSESVVVEDATSGVAAGTAGGFALVLGVDRGGNRTALQRAGADLVVDDLAETLAETS